MGWTNDGEGGRYVGNVLENVHSESREDNIKINRNIVGCEIWGQIEVAAVPALVFGVQTLLV
jgi:hypothetical protein